MDNDSFNPLKIRASQIVGLKKLLVSKAEIETLIAKSIVASEANIEKLVATLVTAAEANIEKLVVKEAEIKTLIVSALKALSLELPVETGKFPHNTIRWFLVEVEKAFITVIEAANKRNVTLELGTLAEKVAATLTIRARNKGTGPGEEALVAAIIGTIGAESLTIVGENGQSQFLQLAALGKRKIMFGTSTFTVGSGFANSLPVEVFHGLNANPILAFGGIDFGAENYDIVFEVRPVSATVNTVHFQAICSSPVPGEVSPGFWWVVIA